MTDRVIADPEHTYLLNDTDFNIYLTEVKEARNKAGLKVENDDFCPLLVAERQEIEAARVMLKTMIPITKIDPDSIWKTEHWHKLIDLTLRLLAPYVK